MPCEEVTTEKRRNFVISLICHSLRVFSALPEHLIHIVIAVLRQVTHEGDVFFFAASWYSERWTG